MNRFIIKSRSRVLQYLANITQPVHVVYATGEDPFLIIVPDSDTLNQSVITVKERA